MKSLVRNLVRQAGFELQQIAPAYGTLTDYRKAISIVRDSTMLPDVRLLSLYDQVRYCDEAGIAGDFVECGVWKGGAVAMMALASNRTRRLHLFDCFSDICEPDAEMDGERAAIEVGLPKATGKLEPISGFYDTFGGHGTIDHCRDLLECQIGYPGELIHFHQGWFQDTVPAAEIKKIAILRLDGDWYASTKICLEHLFDRVVPGGFVVIDDYGAYDGCRRATDEFFAARGIMPFLQPIDLVARYFIKASEQVSFNRRQSAPIQIIAHDVPEGPSGEPRDIRYLPRHEPVTHSGTSTTPAGLGSSRDPVSEGQPAPSHSRQSEPERAPAS